MDRTPLRQGGVVQIWMAALGEESVYEADLPACCRRSARGAEDSFECHSCGAMWQAPLPVEPEYDAFAGDSRGSEKGAA